MIRRGCTLFAAVAAGVLLSQAPADGTILNLDAHGGPNDTRDFFEAWPSADEGSGKVQNLTDAPMAVTVELEAIDPVALGPVAPGYEIIDTTKLVLTTDPVVTGVRRVKIRVKKKATRRIRRMARREGYRPEDLVLMVRARQAPARELRAKWRPCARLMRLRGCPPRPKPGSATFDLGDYGVDTTDEYVWAVTDAPGAYAIGVPEPATIGCLLVGAGALVAASKRRKS